MSTLDQIYVELGRVADNVRRLFEEVQSANGRIAERLLKLRVDQKQLLRIEESLRRIEESGQRVERISPHNLAARIPKSTLEEARRIVAEAEAKGEEISPQFKGEGVSGVWVVATEKVKFKVPNAILRGVLTALLGAILTYLGIAIHDANQRPLVQPAQSTPAPASVPAQSTPVPAQSTPVPAQSADGGRR